MPLLNPRNKREAQKEVAIQERRRASIERNLGPRLAITLNRAVLKASEIYQQTGQLNAVMAFLERHANEIQDILAPAYALIIETFSKYSSDQAAISFGKRLEKREIEDDVIEQLIRDWVLGHGLEQSVSIAETTKKLVRQSIVEGITKGLTQLEIGNLIIKNAGGAISTARARLIARTETHISSQKSVLETVKRLDLPPMYKRWIPALDKRTRESHQDMMKHSPIDMNGLFKVPSENGSDLMEHPSDPRGSASNVINCRCVLVMENVN